MKKNIKYIYITKKVYLKENDEFFQAHGIQ